MFGRPADLPSSFVISGRTREGSADTRGAHLSEM
jgi:hypothetical protein